MNAKMSELRSCFEAAGFTNVKTVLSSGNVVFDASLSPDSALEQSAESAMQASIGRTFSTLIEKTFGADVTTRTWDTIKKCAAA